MPKKKPPEPDWNLVCLPETGGCGCMCWTAETEGTLRCPCCDHELSLIKEEEEDVEER